MHGESVSARASGALWRAPSRKYCCSSIGISKALDRCHRGRDAVKRARMGRKKRGNAAVEGAGESVPSVNLESTRTAEAREARKWIDTWRNKQQIGKTSASSIANTARLLDNVLETKTVDTEPGESVTTNGKVSTTMTNSDSPKKSKTPPLMNRGRLTAILSGAVAVLLGVGYLALASFLDSRELLPPPPEAFM